MSGSKPPDHPITSAASMRRLYYLLLAKPRFRRAYLRLLRTILRTYFRPQFFRPRGHAKIALDTELDAQVPFDATWLPCYVGFVRLWMGSLGWLHLRFGDRALPEMEAFAAGLEALFLEASKVFRECDSTLATRPGPLANLDSIVIHITDRNSFCFPSLHVMIVRFNALRMEAILDRLRGPEEDFAAEKAFLEERALRIIESIIHVKQHGLSDIPAGLFLLQAMREAEAALAGTDVTDGIGNAQSERRPVKVPDEELRFLDRLFPADGTGRLRPFMMALYRRLAEARSAGGQEAHAVLLAFLRDYRNEVSALLRR